MKKLILFLFVGLTGCAQFVPIERKFPEAPSILMQPCPDLQSLDTKTTKLSDVLVVVSGNYGQYHECQIKLNEWIDWYSSQKKIFESVK